jgi:hypothetical protein
MTTPISNLLRRMLRTDQILERLERIEQSMHSDLILKRLAASKTPMDAYVDGYRATWISTGHPTRISGHGLAAASIVAALSNETARGARTAKMLGA